MDKQLKSGASENSIFSEALNNINFLSGGVDPQSGLYSSTFDFGEVHGSRTLGPSFKLQMQFSSLSTLSETNSSRLGLGWNLLLPSYDAANNLLTLIDGRTFKVNEATVTYNGPDRPWVSSHLVADVRVFGSNPNGNKIITVQSKDGSWYELLPDITGGTFNLDKIYAPNGHYLKFQYSISSNTSYLSKIVDSENRTLFQLSYEKDFEGNSTENFSYVSAFPGSPFERLVTLNYNNSAQKLAQIDIQASALETLSTLFSYEAASLTLASGAGFNTMQSIDKVTHPSGATEEIIYEAVIGLPYQAPWTSFLPGVSTYKRKDSNLVTSTTTYELALNQHNFLGTGQQGVNWENASDCLAKLEEGYTYSTRSTEDCGKVTLYTYNKFHQETCKVVHFGDETASITQTTQYNGDDTISVENAAQSPLYELPLAKITEVKDGTELLTLHSGFTFDDWGNLLTHTHPTGIVEEHNYYGSAGENDPANGFVCPAHPFGMEAFMRESITWGIGKEISSNSITTYKSVPNGTAGSMILQATLSQVDQCTTYRYQGETGLTADYPGAPFDEVHTYLGNTRTVTYEYEFIEAQYAKKVSQAFAGSDGSSGSSYEVTSFLTENVLEILEPDGSHQHFAYDLIGRVTSMVNALGSNFESTTTYEYVPVPSLGSAIDYQADILSEIGSGWMIKEENPSSETYHHTVYDGNRRELRSYVRATGSSYYKISELNYDGLGRVTSEKALDHDLNLPNSPVQFEEVETTDYGKWGQPSEKTASNGLIQSFSIAPTQFQVTRQQFRRDNPDDPTAVTASRFAERVTYNLFGKPELQETLDNSGTPIANQSATFDALGRITTLTNASGEVVSINGFDDYGRPSQLTHLDGTVFTIDYAATGPQRLVSGITAQPVTGEERDAPFQIYSQSFDLMDRVVSRTMGTTSSQYEYIDGSTHPIKVLNGRQQTSLFEVLPALGDRPARVTTFDQPTTVAEWDTATHLSDDHYFYGSNSDTNAPLGQLLATNPSSSDSFAYTYQANGLVAALTQTTNGVAHNQEIVRQTLLGKVLELKVTEPSGDRIILMAYDSQGNLASTQDGDVLIELFLNGFGELETETISQNTIQLQQTSIAYNAKGLEWKRTIDSALGNTVLEMESGYDLEDRIKTRSTKVGGVVKRSEEFSYDVKGRLELYGHVSGYDSAYLPLNGYGLPFVSQAYTYDSLDNILTLTTTLADGQPNIATYGYTGQQVNQISNSLNGDGQFPAVVNFDYDADGNLTQMGDQSMSYNPFGRLENCQSSGYQYDAFQRLVKAGDSTRVYFQTDPISLSEGDSTTHLIRSGVKTVAERTDGDLMVLGLDMQNSVVLNSSAGSANVRAYDSLGAGSGESKSGFNGGLRDATIGGYFLGNGVRAYFPILGNFASQDDFTPFEGGGLNPYAYCNRNPMNLIDPSGHMSEVAQLGTKVGLAVLGLLASIAGVVAAIPTGGASLGASGAALAAIAVGFASLGAAGSVLGLTASSMALHDELEGSDHAKQIDILNITSRVLGVVSSLFSAGKFGYGLSKKEPQFPRTLGDKYVYDPLKDTGKVVYKCFRTFGLVPSAKKAKGKASAAFRKVRGKGKSKSVRRMEPGQLALEYHPSTTSSRSSQSSQSSSSIRNVAEQPQTSHLPQDAPELNMSSDQTVGRRSRRSLSGQPMDTSQLTRNTMHVVDNE